MADAKQEVPGIQGTLPLYKKPEPLNVQTHKGMGVKFEERPFDFLSDAHFVPVTIGEIGAASAHYPVIFLGEGRLPVAVMGLQQGSNLFVDPATGRFEPLRYLPGFVRRYPFVAAIHPDENERFTVCIDAASSLVSNKPDQPFFTDDGELTDYSRNAVEFVRLYETEVVASNEMITRLKALDLFEQQTTKFQPRHLDGQPNGEPQTIATYWGISHDKLRALPVETLAELRDNMYLAVIYAHMISMAQWEFIIARAQARTAGAAPAAPAAPMAPPPPEA